MNRYKFEDLKVGMEESFEVTVTQEMQDMFGKMSGDSNPLHVDEEFAKSHGYSQCVVYGMLVASFYSKLVGVYLPGENCLFHEISATFERPVFVGDKLIVGGGIEDIRESTGRIKIKARIINQNDETVGKAKLTVGFTSPTGKDSEDN